MILKSMVSIVSLSLIGLTAGCATTLDCKTEAVCVPPPHLNKRVQQSALDIYRLRLFFGLSLPGGGSISLNEWQLFQQNEIAKVFDGFNVVDSIGYYKGTPERSKIVTLIIEEKEIPKAKELAARYAKQFDQDSVMLVKVPVLEWSFIKAE